MHPYQSLYEPILRGFPADTFDLHLPDRSEQTLCGLAVRANDQWMRWRGSYNRCELRRAVAGLLCQQCIRVVERREEATAA